MTRLSIFPLLAALLFCMAGCGPKPENTVETYLKRMHAYDITGAKKLCTNGAREALDNPHEDLVTQRVFAVGEGDTETGEGSSWDEFRASFIISVDDEFAPLVFVAVTTREEEVRFTMTEKRGQWLISGVSNPKFGLPGYRKE